MARELRESFSFYGGSTTRATEGRWTVAPTGILVPAWETDPRKYWARRAFGGLANVGGRIPLGFETDEIIYSQRFHLTDFSSITSGAPRHFALLSAGLGRIVDFGINNAGQLTAYANGSAVATTPAQVVFPGVSHHIEIYALRHPSAGAIRVDIDGATVLNLSDLAMGSNSFAIYAPSRQTSNANFAHNIFITDIWIRDIGSSSASPNSNFEPASEVATLFVREDTNVDGWTFRARRNLGTGILDLRANTNSAVSCADSADLEIGAQDFEFTGWVRFRGLPTGTNKAQIAGKWQTSGNQRSWQLYKAGPDLDSGALVFRTSTDGTAGTVNHVFEWPWEPEVDVWYGVSIQRESGITRLFIAERNPLTNQWDFIERGQGFADAATYFNASAALAIGGEMSSSTSVLSNTGVNGFMDECRFTNGVARNTASYSLPNTPLPRGAGNDPEWSNVVLLAGFDSGINDESSSSRTVTARSGAVMYTPDDGQSAYQSIEHADPRDDTFIEAALVAAEGVLSFTGQVTDGDTITLGSVTYTYVDVLDSADGPADVIVIGGTTEETILNTIAAINGDSGSGTTYGAGTDPNPDCGAGLLPGDQMLAFALVPGAAGNALDTLSTAANATWDAATLDGGADIPGPSEFLLTRPPRDAARVFSYEIIAREYKSAAGPAETSCDFVDQFGASEDGSPQPLTNNPAYRTKVEGFTDPTTAGALTPSTFVNSRVRISRDT